MWIFLDSLTILTYLTREQFNISNEKQFDLFHQQKLKQLNTFYI